MPTHTARRFVALLLTSLSAACGGGGGGAATVDVGPVYASSLVPRPGSDGVSRRVVVRVGFDVELDPRTVTGEACYVQGFDGAVVPANVAWDAATSSVTITPTVALEPYFNHRVVVTAALRSPSGREVVPLSWAFTTANHPVWAPSREVASGRLLACSSSRAQGALAVWREPDGTIRFARFHQGIWFDATPLAVHNVRAAAVADDRDGAAVVAVATFPPQGNSLWLARHAGAGTFWPAEAIGAGWFDHVSVDHDDGLLLVAARRLDATGAPDVAWTRAWGLGFGWLAPETTFASAPLAYVIDQGHGFVVHGRNRLQPFDHYVPWCERQWHSIGVPGSVSETPPATPNSSPFAAKLKRFGDSVLCTQTVEGATPLQQWLVTRVFRRDAQFGWTPLPMELPAEPDAHDIAIGPLGIGMVGSIRAGEPPVTWDLVHATAYLEPAAPANMPAPEDPVIATTITTELVRGAVWTARASGAPDAPVWLMANARDGVGIWQEATPIDGPFDQHGIRDLRIVPTGPRSALALWTRDERVYWSQLR